MPFWNLFRSIHMHFFLSKLFSHKGHIYGKCGHCLAGNYMGQAGPKMLIFVVGSVRLILVFSQKALFWIPVK